MNFPKQKIVDMVKEKYKQGDSVILLQMDDAQAPPIGTKGKVLFVDDTGSIHVNWETGGSLAIVYGVDKCRKI